MGENDPKEGEIFTKIFTVLDNLNNSITLNSTKLDALAKEVIKEDSNNDEQPDPLKPYYDAIRKFLGEKMDAKELEGINDSELLVAAKLSPKMDTAEQNKHPSDRTQTETNKSGLPWWLTQHAEEAVN
jgi:hypothetical protein